MMALKDARKLHKELQEERTRMQQGLEDIAKAHRLIGVPLASKNEGQEDSLIYEKIVFCIKAILVSLIILAILLFPMFYHSTTYIENNITIEKPVTIQHTIENKDAGFVCLREPGKNDMHCYVNKEGD